MICVIAGLALLSIALGLGWKQFQIWHDTVHTVAQVKQQTSRTWNLSGGGTAVMRYEIEYDGITSNLVLPVALEVGDHIPIYYRKKYPMACSTHPNRSGLWPPIVCLCLAGGLLYYGAKRFKDETD